MNEEKAKAKLKEARLCLLQAQVIVRPTDERWGKIDKLLEPLEEMIMSRHYEQGPPTPSQETH